MMKQRAFLTFIMLIVMTGVSVSFATEAAFYNSKPKFKVTKSAEPITYTIVFDHGKERWASRGGFITGDSALFPPAEKLKGLVDKKIKAGIFPDEWKAPEKVNSDIAFQWFEEAFNKYWKWKDQADKYKSPVKAKDAVKKTEGSDSFKPIFSMEKVSDGTYKIKFPQGREWVRGTKYNSGTTYPDSEGFSDVVNEKIKEGIFPSEWKMPKKKMRGEDVFAWFASSYTKYEELLKVTAPEAPQKTSTSIENTTGSGIEQQKDIPSAGVVDTPPNERQETLSLPSQREKNREPVPRITLEEITDLLNTSEKAEKDEITRIIETKGDSLQWYLLLTLGLGLLILLLVVALLFFMLKAVKNEKQNGEQARQKRKKGAEKIIDKVDALSEQFAFLTKEIGIKQPIREASRSYGVKQHGTPITGETHTTLLVQLRKIAENVDELTATHTDQKDAIQGMKESDIALKELIEKQGQLSGEIEKLSHELSVETIADKVASKVNPSIENMAKMLEEKLNKFAAIITSSSETIELLKSTLYEVKSSISKVENGLKKRVALSQEELGTHRKDVLQFLDDAKEKMGQALKKIDAEILSNLNANNSSVSEYLKRQKEGMEKAQYSLVKQLSELTRESQGVNHSVADFNTKLIKLENDLKVEIKSQEESLGNLYRTHSEELSRSLLVESEALQQRESKLQGMELMKMHQVYFPDDSKAEKLFEMERTPLINAFYFQAVSGELETRLDQAWKDLFEMKDEGFVGSEEERRQDHFCYSVLYHARFREVFAEIFKTNKMKQLLESSIANDQKDFIRNWGRNAGSVSNGIPIGAIGGLMFFLEAMLMPMLQKRHQSHPVFRIYSVLNGVEGLIREYGESVGVRFHKIPLRSAVSDCPYMQRENRVSVVMKNILEDEKLLQTFHKWAIGYFMDVDREHNDMIVNVSALGYCVEKDGKLLYEEKTYVSTYNDIQHVLKGR